MKSYKRARRAMPGLSLRILLIASTTLATACGTAAVAQETTRQPDAETSASPSLEDIIVTAQKRSQRLQDVPISVSVVSGKTITDQNFRSLQDLSRTQPAFNASTVGRGARVSLRGISSGTNSSFDQSVVTFIDDVYHGKVRSSGSTLLDIDRIELLKGPQTTFFGNNAIAGAVNVQTARPVQSNEGSVRGLYGADGEYAAEAIINVPLSSTLAIRAAGLLNGMNGFIEDRSAGGNLPRERNAAGRLSALWKPSDTFTLFLKAEATRSRNAGGAGSQLVDCRTSLPTPVRPYCGVTTNTPAGPADQILNYVRDQNPGVLLNLSTQDYQATAALDLGSATLTSVSAYSGFQFLYTQDVDGTPAAGIGLRGPQRLEQYSQEFRLASNDGQALLSYIVGAYYQSSRYNDLSELTFGVLTPFINANPAYAGLRSNLPFGQSVDVLQKEETVSGFASLTWRPTSALAVTVGARYASVNKGTDQVVTYGQSGDAFGNIAPYTGTQAALAAVLATSPTTPVALGAPGTRNLDRTDSKFTPTLNIQYKFSPTLNVYASYSEGFKAGGFNGTLTTAPTASLAFGPEKVTAYEAGLRSEFFDRRLLFNVSAFYSLYKDLQVSIFAPSTGGAPVSIITNAASAVSQGIELESRFAVSRSFSIGTSMTFLDSKFKNFPNGTPSAGQRLAGLTAQDMSGKRTAFAPQFAANFNVNYKQPIANTLIVELDANLLHQSSYFTTDQADPSLAQPTYDKIDARASISTLDENWQFSIIGKNLTNRLIINSGTDAGVPQTYFFNVERPRSVVFQLRHKW